VSPPEQQSLSSSPVVVRSALFNVAGFLVSSVYMLLMVPIAVHFVGVDLYGLWLTIMGITGYFGLADLGLNTSLVKYIAEYAAAGRPDDVNRVVMHGLFFYVGLTVIIVIVGFFAFPFVFALLGLNDGYFALGREVFILSLIAFGVSSVMAVIGGILFALQRADLYTMIMNVLYAVKLAGVWIVLMLEMGIAGLAAVEVVGGALALGPLYLAARSVYPRLSLRPGPYDPALLKRLLLFGTQLQVSKFAEVVQAQWDKLLLTRFVGLSAVTVYDIGVRPLSRIRAIPILAISSLVPAVSVLHTENDHERIMAAMMRSTRYLALFGAPSFCFAIAFASDILTAWIGTAYPESILACRVMSVALFLNLLSAGMSFVAQGQGRPGYQMRATLAQLIVNIVLSTVLASLYGFPGAVVGTSIAVTTGSIMFIWTYGRTQISNPIRSVMRMTVKPLLLLVPAVVVTLLTREAIIRLTGAPDRWEALLLLPVELVVFGLVYGMGIRMSRVLSEDDRRFMEKALEGRGKILASLLVPASGGSRQ
jgi:O-antigen/teichoic acid export membrane protein